MIIRIAVRAAMTGVGSAAAGKAAGTTSSAATDSRAAMGTTAHPELPEKEAANNVIAEES